MKPWLLNLLACPIDKHHPLQAYFFKWASTPEEIEEQLAAVGNTPNAIKDELKILAKQVVDGVISQAAVESIHDQSGVDAAVKFHGIVVEAVKHVVSLKESGVRSLVDSESLGSLHRYMNLLDVEIGILYCTECGRWYPIGSSIESVPEMLPDDLREEEKDQAWLREWQEKIPENILQSGKPYSLPI